MFGGKKISSVVAREILDSRGNPTVACRVTLKNGLTAEAKVPSGASTGSHEALELRDGGKRYGGKGVKKAVKHVNESIARVLRGIDVTRQQDIDHVMLELDGTKNKSKLGANAILAVSLACAQVAALERGIPLWKSLRQTYRFVRPASLPIPTMNVLNGGAHAGWVMDIQECMIVSKHKVFSERVRIGVEVFQALGKLLKEKHLPITVGDEGGFAPHLDTVEKAFELLAEAVAKAGFKLGKDVYFAADVASSEFYDAKRKKYVFRAEGVEMDREQLMARYAGWMEKYPFESIEDPFAEDDWASWQEALPMFEGNEVRVVGDDLLVTNVERLRRAIDEQAANTILIKLNQIGTLTETVDAIKMAHEAGWATSISHRSGETADTTIADLAVACGSEYIKTGSLSRSERIEKYNRLLEIEGEM
ncbi:phosphopyruvate hydratase [Patescibacteria group bacterium]|nr:phosphopyruvate hydratase [Patescibacteria group bacterium]MBP9710051.1 phosphopyruvate hydratase [Patescibacteria group bacterium]